MVLFNQSTTHAEKKRYFEEMLSYRESKIAITDKTQYEYYDKWYHAAIRAILEFHDFDGDCAQLAKMMTPAISASEAKRSIELLRRLSLIAPDTQGRLRPAGNILCRRCYRISLEQRSEPASARSDRVASGNRGVRHAADRGEQHQSADLR